MNMLNVALPRHGILVLCAAFTSLPPVMSAADETSVETQLAALKADNKALRKLIPSQSHAMTDVAYQFTNLWFAGTAENWPLAQFYFNEARSHIAWAIRLVPVRRTANGELPLQPIFDAFDKAELSELKQAIAEKRLARFKSSYKTVTDGCTACHVAAEKPYLHIVPPKGPEAQVVQFSR